jgi:hypothetical protein
MAEIRTIQLNADPETAGIKTATLEVRYGDMGGAATVMLRPGGLLPRNMHGLRVELHQLAQALSEAPILPQSSADPA